MTARSVEFVPLLGIPFAEKRCLGLVASGLALLGIPWEDPWVRGIDAAWAQGNHRLDAPPGWQRLPAETPLQRGDVVLSRSADGVPSHVSLAVGPRDILHTTKSTGSVITTTRVLRGRIEAVYRREGA